MRDCSVCDILEFLLHSAAAVVGKQFQRLISPPLQHVNQHSAALADAASHLTPISEVRWPESSRNAITPSVGRMQTVFQILGEGGCLYLVLTSRFFCELSFRLLRSQLPWLCFVRHLVCSLYSGFCGFMLNNLAKESTQSESGCFLFFY